MKELDDSLQFSVFLISMLSWFTIKTLGKRTNKLSDKVYALSFPIWNYKKLALTDCLV